MSNLNVLRKTKQANFAVIDMEPIRNDSRLSFKAKGLLVYLLDRPANWNVNIEHLATVSAEGKGAIQTAVAELKDCGYLRIEKDRDGTGKVTGYTWELTENPKKLPLSGETKPKPKKPYPEKPYTDKPYPDNPPLISTGYTNHGSLPNTKKTNTDFLPEKPEDDPLGYMPTGNGEDNVIERAVELYKSLFGKPGYKANTKVQNQIMNRYREYKDRHSDPVCHVIQKAKRMGDNGSEFLNQNCSLNMFTTAGCFENVFEAKEDANKTTKPSAPPAGYEDVPGAYKQSAKGWIYELRNDPHTHVTPDGEEIHV